MKGSTKTRRANHSTQQVNITMIVIHERDYTDTLHVGPTYHHEMCTRSIILSPIMFSTFSEELVNDKWVKHDTYPICI